MQSIIQLTYLISSLISTVPQSGEHLDQSPVQVIEVGDHEILPGVLRPTEEVTLSTSFDTMLGELRVEEGQVVTRGQIVAVLDDRVVRAALRLAEIQAFRTAQVEHAVATLKSAEDRLKRIRTANNSRAATEVELVVAQTDRDLAAADLKSAREAQEEAHASLALAQARLEEHMVRAPFDGLILRIHTEPGAMVSPGDPILELVSSNGLCVDFNLPASIASSLREGDQYAISVEVPKFAVVPGTIRYIEPRVDPVSRTMRVVLDIDRQSTSNTRSMMLTRCIKGTSVVGVQNMSVKSWACSS